MSDPGPTLLRDEALAVWRAGVEACEPAALVRQALRVVGDRLRVGDLELRLGDLRSIAVAGAGKAGRRMVRGVEQALGPRVLRTHFVHGLVAVPDGEVEPRTAVELVGTRAGSDNRPTARGAEAAERVRRVAGGLARESLLLCPFSGGGSALLPAPVRGISLEDKLTVTALLQEAGASIVEMNAVRKHLSFLKGGGLARIGGAGQVVGLLLSDVIGDPLDVIASGPTAPDPSTYAGALSVLEQYRLLGGTEGPAVPSGVERHLARGAAGELAETPAEPIPWVANVIVGSNATAVAGAAAEAERRGLRVVDLGSDTERDTRRVAARLAGAVREAGSGTGAVCIISGGETTVDLGDGPAPAGRGGRNQELALALLVELGQGVDGVAAVVAGTDGEDGPTDAAGGIVDGETAGAVTAQGLPLDEHLARHDAYPLLEAAGGLLRTGLTGTNVADLRVVVVRPGGAASGNLGA